MALFLNKDYLNRVFKKAHGVSISQYLIQERMKLAGMLLKNPGCSVNAAAEKTGYNNYSYFASSFSGITDARPCSIKKKIRRKTMNNRPVKTAVVGCGSISDIYLQNMIGKYKNLEVTACCAKHMESAERKGRSMGFRPGPMKRFWRIPRLRWWWC